MRTIASEQRSHRRTLIILACITLLVYLPGFWWGAPYATAADRTRSWGVDDETPLGPLAEAHNILQPKPDRNLGYPLMYFFLALLAYFPYLGYLWLSGNMVGVSGVYPFGLLDPVRALNMMTYIAHLLTVLMATGVVLAAYEAGRVLWDRRTGILGALFALVNYPMFYYARTGNVDVPLLFFIAAATAVFAHAIRFGLDRRRALLLGMFIGFALATKESSVGSFLAIPVVLLWLDWKTARTLPARGQTLWRSALWGLLATIVAFGAGSGLFIEPSRYLAHLQFIAGRLDTLASGSAPIIPTYLFTLEGHLAYTVAILRYLIDAMTLPGLALALVGVSWSLLRREIGGLFGWTGVSYLVFTFLTLRAAQMRYFLPIMFVLAIFAGRAVSLGISNPRQLVRVPLVVLASAVLGVGLLRGASLTHEMIYDARYAAAAWLAARTQPGDRVEFFGPSTKLPPLEEGVVTATATDYFGIYVPTDTSPAKAQEILEAWQVRKPKFILLIPDLTSPPGKPYNFTCPPRLCDALLAGELDYRLAATFHTPPLFPWLELPALDYPTVNPPIRVFAEQALDDDNVTQSVP